MRRAMRSYATSWSASGDPDADNLSNINEYNKKTNPRVADTDGDALSDGDEVYTSHTDPLAQYVAVLYFQELAYERRQIHSARTPWRWR